MFLGIEKMVEGNMNQSMNQSPQESTEMKKVQWIDNTKYELTYNRAKELEICRYHFPLRGYGNYAAICISYKDGVLRYIDFSDGLNGSGIHFIEEKKGVKIDVDELAKDSPQSVFVYLVLFFMDERTIDILFNDDDDGESEEDLIDEEEKKELEEEEKWLEEVEREEDEEEFRLVEEAELEEFEDDLDDDLDEEEDEVDTLDEEEDYEDDIEDEEEEL